MSNYYALLIAVDFYFPGQLPGGGYYPSLGGCVRDVDHVEAYLKQRLKLPAAQILKLSATNSATGKPPEPAEQLPTYENMVAKFKELKAMAQSGDYVYIHYSGHGGRTKTIYPDLKGADGIDETLVPTDIHNTNAHYLRDVELAYLLQEMVAQGLRVTVVLDSCHSGGATRGVGGAVARGVSFIDNTDRPADSLVASAEELAANWQGQSGGASRSVKPASGWLLEPKGYTLFAACRANESAYEYAFDGRERNGALTYWLLDSLRQAGPGFSYKMIHDRILAKVHGLFDQQTPQLQGEGNLAIFGSDLIEPYYAVGVIKVQNGQVQLDAGVAHGLAVGAQFAVYAFGATDLSTEAGRVAIVTLDRVDDLSSWAKVTEQLGDKAVEDGAQAVLLSNVNLRLQRNVAVTRADAALQQQVQAAITADGKGFIKVAGAGDQVDFQVTVNDAGEYELWDPAGKVIPNLRPALRAQDANALKRLVGRLIQLAKYRNVQDLDVANPSARQLLRVELLGASDTAGETPIFHPGDRVKFKISNTQTPNPADPNDPKRVLNICVLDLQSDWGITQIYPAGAAAFEIVDPGKSIDLEFEAYLPDGYTESTDVLKVFATQATTNFRWLELPVLDQPDTRSFSTRSVITDPLEQMLADLTIENPTRAVRLTSAPQTQSWATAQVELRVKQ